MVNKSFQILFENDGWNWTHNFDEFEQKWYPAKRVWLDVRADTCVSDPDACHSKWQLLGSVGTVVAMVALGCTVLPCMLDLYHNRLVGKRRACILGPYADAKVPRGVDLNWERARTKQLVRSGQIKPGATGFEP